LEFSDREYQSMKVDIRARVLWGDSKETIQSAWLAKGAPGPQVNSALEDALDERLRHFRLRGAQDLLIGLGLIGIGAILAWFQYALYRGQIEMAVSAKMMALVWIGMVGMPLAGLHFSLRGIRRMVGGGLNAEAASDMSEFDYFDKD
jgi:hypothetical protein